LSLHMNANVWGALIVLIQLAVRSGWRLCFCGFIFGVNQCLDCLTLKTLPLPSKSQYYLPVDTAPNSRKYEYGGKNIYIFVHCSITSGGPKASLFLILLDHNQTHPIQ